jgi:pre-mRNA-splicing helicase BRR2
MVQGFEEIHVPALKPKPFAKDERIVKIKDLPAWMHPAFEGMDALNRIQSRVCCHMLIGVHSESTL